MPVSVLAITDLTCRSNSACNNNFYYPPNFSLVDRSYSNLDSNEGGDSSASASDGLLQQVGKRIAVKGKRPSSSIACFLHIAGGETVFEKRREEDR